MGIQQKELLFGTNQTLSSISSGSTSTIGSVVNLGLNRDFYDSSRGNYAGKSGRLWLTILVETIFATSGSPVMTIALQTKSTSASFSSGATTVIELTGSEISQTQAAGTFLYQGPIPAHDAVKLQQYVGINATMTSGTASTGSITAFLSMDADLNV